MIKIFLTVAFGLSFPPLCYAGPVESVVKDKKTGETLIGSTIKVKGDLSIGTTSGLDGSFSLKNL